MKVLKRVGVVSAAKVTGVLAAIFGLILGIGFALVGVHFGGGLGSLGVVPVWLVSLIGFPIIYGLVGVIGGALYAALYNLVAGLVGGIEIELE